MQTLLEKTPAVILTNLGNTPQLTFESLSRLPQDLQDILYNKIREAATYLAEIEKQRQKTIEFAQDNQMPLGSEHSSTDTVVQKLITYEEMDYMHDGYHFEFVDVTFQHTIPPDHHQHKKVYYNLDGSYFITQESISALTFGSLSEEDRQVLYSKLPEEVQSQLKDLDPNDVFFDYGLQPVRRTYKPVYSIVGSTFATRVDVEPLDEEV